MSDTGSKTSKSFVKEAAILSLSGFAVKFIGLVYKIPLTTILDESMGVFTAAYSIYAMLFMISTSGLPVAISRMIAGSAEKGRLIETKKILKMSVFMFSVVGNACS
ncbi:MAG TPA: polysaccharide biosynthesis protein, partial [Clostridiales bacterium]|nr:polysaccharide biosynthesis protein [Clostridiales bacterium]